MYSNGIARFYDFFYQDDGRSAHECAFVHRAAPDRGRLLEVGSGIGRTAFALAAAGFEVTALEPDPEMFGVLLTRLALRQDLENNLSPVNRPFGFPLHLTFETCACFNVLHLLQPAARAALFEFVSAHLVTGGRFILNAPVSAPSRATRLRSLAAERKFGSTIFRHFSTQEHLSKDQWRTAWEFTVSRGDEVLDATIQAFDWQTSSIAELESLATMSGLVVEETYADLDCSRFVEGENREVVIVACARR